MSRTYRERNRKGREIPKDIHDGKLQKWHHHKGKMGHVNCGKHRLCPGGLDCNCNDIRGNPTEIKVLTRRLERRTFDFHKLFIEQE